MKQPNRGFSLIEMSMVLIIATLIIGTVLKAINAMQYGVNTKDDVVYFVSNSDARTRIAKFK